MKRMKKNSAIIGMESLYDKCVTNEKNTPILQ